ncbi:MAG: TlpA disulfide reductase family protein [Nitrospirota bacterium]
MRRLLFSFFLGLIVFCCPIHSGQANEGIPVREGDPFPDIPLAGIFSEEDWRYLGSLKEKGRSLSRIRSDFLLVELFSIYCPVCQKNAPKLATLYNSVQGDNFLKRNIKFIGIGAGNNLRETEYFKKYFSVPFPLIPDPQFKIHKALKDARAPLLIIVDKRKNPRIVAVLDFTKAPADLMKDIRAGINIHTKND